MPHECKIVDAGYGARSRSSGAFKRSRSSSRLGYTRMALRKSRRLESEAAALLLERDQSTFGCAR